MAADPHRSNQPLVNGQNGEGGPSKGNSNRDTVDGEDLVQKAPQPQQNPQPQAPFGLPPHQQPPPSHHGWPRLLRPPDPRGPPRPPQQPGIRRLSPWAVLRNKLPDQPQQFQQYRMQSDDPTRPPLNGFAPRPPPPQMAMRPPSGQLSKPPSLEGPSPPLGPTPPRSPFLQRGDSRTGAQMFTPPMQRPPLSLSPRPGLSINRSRDEDDGDDLTSVPGGVRPPGVRFPTPQLVRTPSGGVSPVPSRPPSRATPSPTPPLGPRATPPLQPSRQPSLNNLSEPQADAKSSTPSPRPLSAATSQESDDTPAETAKPAEVTKPAETAKPPETAKPTDTAKPSEPDKAKTPNVPEDEVPKKAEDAPKRPNLLETTRREKTETLNGHSSDLKGIASDSKTKETVVNGSHETPKKLPPKTTATTPKKLGPVPVGAKSPSKSLPRTPQTPDTPGTSEKKKLPMNKIQVGAVPSPNLKVVRSKIGSLENAKHKPGGGNIKIESRKLEFKAGPRIEAKNDTYAPGGGEKKIQQVKLQWNAKSKIGSLENATHKPGGGDKKIESVKLDFKDKAKPKIGSKDNIKHIPGGGNVKIEDQKLEIKAQSKIGSLDNVKHKPGGGEVKIFDDREYMKQMMGSTSDVHSASNQRRTSRSSSSSRTRLSGSKSGTRENLTDDLYSPEKPTAKPLTKPTDQNSNQLNRSQPETAAASSADVSLKPKDGPKEDFQSVIEKSQTETPEKQLTKP